MLFPPGTPGHAALAVVCPTWCFLPWLLQAAALLLPIRLPASLCRCWCQPHAVCSSTVPALGCLQVPRTPIPLSPGFILQQPAPQRVLQKLSLPFSAAAASRAWVFFPAWPGEAGGGRGGCLVAVVVKPESAGARRSGTQAPSSSPALRGKGAGRQRLLLSARDAAWVSPCLCFSPRAGG